MILRGTAPKRLSPSSRLAVLALAVVLLPLLPQMVEPGNSPTASATVVAPAERPMPGYEAAPTLGQPEEPARPAPQQLARQAQRGPLSTAPRTAAAPSISGLEDFWATAHSPDGRRSIHAAEDGSITLIDNRSGRQRLLDRYGVTSVAFSPDGSVFATGCWDHSARLWDAVSGEELAVLQGHADRVNSVAFSPDGHTLVTGSWDHAVKFWNVQLKTERAALPRLTQPVNCVRYSPDGESLAVGLGHFGFGEPGQVQIWRLDTLSQRAVLPCESGVGAVVFTPGGKGLAAGESAGRVTLWDLPSRTPWSGYYLSRENVARAAFWAEVPSFAARAAPSAGTPAGA